MNQTGLTLLARCALVALTLSMTSCDRDYRMNSPAMAPTIDEGDIINIDFHAYDKGIRPKRWDIVAFDSPRNPYELWAHRVVGLPGETISISPTEITINGKPLGVPKGLYYLPAAENSVAITYPYRIPDTSYFLLGDNSEQAFDSRYEGAVPFTRIKGRLKGHSITEPIRKALENSK